MIKTYFSERIYKDTLPKVVVEQQQANHEVFNQAKQFAFQTLVREKREGKKRHDESLHKVVKKRYQLDDYYANSAVQEANALFSSVNELRSLRLAQTDEKISKLKTKIKTEKTKHTKLKNIKQSLIKGKLQLPKNSGYTQQKSGWISKRLKKETLIWANPYLFEHRHIDEQLKRIKANIGRLTHKLRRLEEKKEQLKTRQPSVVFGSKKLFQQQHTNEKYLHHHDQWKQQFQQKRTKGFMISGRKDAGAGNFVFHYDTDSHTLHIRDHEKRPLSFPNVVFPYGQEQVNQAVHTQQNLKDKKKYGKPISWCVEDYGNYYIVKCLIDVARNEVVNYSLGDGIVAIDMNVDHLAWSDVSKDGNYLESGRISFDLRGQSTGQNVKTIEQIAIVAVDLAMKKRKPIAIENIDTTLSKTGDVYGNKKSNAQKSLFAYRKLTEAIQSRADKMGVDVTIVNPAYTSIVGKMKYMRHFGISIHESAAFTIGRRALGYQEKVPAVLKPYRKNEKAHHWAQWYQLNKAFAIDKNAYYNVYSVDRPQQGVDVYHSILSENDQKKLVKALRF